VLLSKAPAVVVVDDPRRRSTPGPTRSGKDARTWGGSGRNESIPNGINLWVSRTTAQGRRPQRRPEREITRGLSEIRHAMAKG
jgi:hypothetical protein